MSGGGKLYYTEEIKGPLSVPLCGAWPIIRQHEKRSFCLISGQSFCFRVTSAHRQPPYRVHRADVSSSGEGRVVCSAVELVSFSDKGDRGWLQFL